MSDLLVPVRGTGTDIAAPLASAAAYARAEKADATRRAYRGDFADFGAWCAQYNEQPLPARSEAVAAYLASLADLGLRACTIERRLAAIAYAHRVSGHVHGVNGEAVRATMRGIRRRIGTAPTRKAPATAAIIAKLLKRIPGDTVLGKRDRALLLLGFAAALRRSELVALQVGDIEWTPEGVMVHIRRSKTDQDGAGHQVAVPRGTKLRPVEALEAWLKTTDITDGPLFRAIHNGVILARALTPQSVMLVVKRCALAARLDPALFAGHSLRAGFVTSALEAGADVLAVMRTTRHRSVTTLQAYDRRAQAFRDHAGRKFL